MDDARSRLRQADQFARNGLLPEAVDAYLAAAFQFADGGFALKAIATLRQVVSIVDRDAPELVDARLQALQRLVVLYSDLGLGEDAAATRKLLRPHAV
ncbi:MAG: hypothetical protein R3B13_21440 [Polyangiaceae bacterium]